MLSPTRVLTAAHCVYKRGSDKDLYETEKFRVHLEQDYNEKSFRQVTCIKPHPNYHATAARFDFAILEVEDMNLNAIDRAAVCLPEEGKHVQTIYYPYLHFCF